MCNARVAAVRTHGRRGDAGPIGYVVTGGAFCLMGALRATAAKASVRLATVTQDARVLASIPCSMMEHMTTSSRLRQ